MNEPTSFPKITRKDLEDKDLGKLNSALNRHGEKIVELFGGAGPVKIASQLSAEKFTVDQEGTPADDELITYGTLKRYVSGGIGAQVASILSGAGAGAGTGGSTETAAQITYVTAEEKTGSRYLDEEGVAHCEIEVELTITAAGTATLWVSMDEGETWIYIGPYEVPMGTSVVYFDALVPVGDSALEWIVAVAGRNCGETSVLPDDAVQSEPFTVAVVGNCPATDITDAQFVVDPVTGFVMTYRLSESGVYTWDFYELNWMQPSAEVDPIYSYSFVTWQKGTVSGGSWVPAPDSEGTDEDADVYHGQYLADSATIQGGASVPGTLVKLRGSYPPAWTFPPAKLADGSVNPYRSFRFWIYAVSARAADGEGPGATPTLQTCWPAGVDHYDLTPESQPPALDLTPYVAIPLEILDQQITLAHQGVTNQYLANQAVAANNMAAAAITAANQALAANAVVDSNVASVNVSKLIAGTVIFTGTVVLSRGSGNPVIVIENTGLHLFSAASAGGTGGLTTYPYVSIQNSGIGLYSGTNASVTLSASAITLWSVSGLASYPYVNIDYAGITLKSQNFTTTITSSAITNSHSSGAYMMLSTSGIKFKNGTYSVVLTGSYLQLWSVDGNAVYPCVGLTSTTLSFTAGSFVTEITASYIRQYHIGGTQAILSASEYRIVHPSGAVVSMVPYYIMLMYNGTLSAPFGSMYVTAGFFKIYANIGGTSTTGFSLDCNDAQSAAHLQLISSTVTNDIVTLYVGYDQLYFDLSHHSYSPVININGAQVLTVRQTGLGTPSGWADATALAWAQSLYSKLAAHGLIT